MHSRASALLASCVVWALCLPGPVRGQDAADRHAAATHQLRRLAADMTAACLNEVRSVADWEAQRPVRRRQLAEMLGLDPLPPRTPLNARLTGTLERPEFRIEKVVFESSPGLYVTGNFYAPTGTPGPAPAILYLCGHSPHPRGAKSQYQDRTGWYARNGYCVLVLDTLEFGEVPGIHHGTHDLGRWSWLSLGYTPAGVEVWNAMRALDWLQTRPEVAADRIGVTGISGGGAITWYLAALDDRVAAAAPSCSTYTFGSQAAHWLARGQCDCIFYHNTYAWDFPVVAALIAPRPLLITSGRNDTIFPPDGYHEVFQRAQRVYDAFAGGPSDRLREVDAEVGHTDAPEFLRASREWMNRWLRNDPRPLDTPPPDTHRETADALACLSELPADAVNFRIQDTFTSPVRLEAPATPADWTRRRTEVLARLRDRVFRGFPAHRVDADVQWGRDSGGWVARYARYRELTLQTEPGVRIRAQLYSPRQPTGPIPLVIVAKEPGETFFPMDVDEWLPLFGRCHLLVVRTRFSETTLGFGNLSDLERTAAWVGRTITSMRIWDLGQSIHWALAEGGLQPSRVLLHGRGDMAVVAMYAGLLDERVDDVVVADPPSSHWQGPALLNVLRFTDLPEVAGALAPRNLTFLRAIPPGFELTRALYDLQQTGTALRVAGSLPEALGPSWSSRSADPADILRRAGNTSDEMERCRELRALAQRPDLDPALRADLHALLPLVEDWAHGRDRLVTDSRRAAENGYLCQFITSRVRPEGEGPVFPAPPSNGSPLRPLWCLYRGRMLIWRVIQSGPLLRVPASRQAYFGEARRLLTEAREAFPENRVLRMYLGEPIPWPQAPVADSRAPLWANLQREGLEKLTEVIHWWIRERQLPDGQFGGGWGDDVEMWRWWAPVLIGFDDPRIQEAQERLSHGMFAQPHLAAGFTSRITDVEHSNEDTTDSILPMMHLRPGDPLWSARARRLIHLMREHWTGRNARGFLQFRSIYFSVDRVDPDPTRAFDTVYHPAVLQPALLYWQRTGDPEVEALIRDWLKVWIDVTARAENGKPAGILPSAIRWPEGTVAGPNPPWWEPFPAGHNDALYNWPGATRLMTSTLLLAFHQTGDETCLAPLRSMAELRRRHRGSSDPAPPGSEAWCAARLRGFLSDTLSKYRLLTGLAEFDDLLESDASSYTRFRLRGDRAALEKALLRNAEAFRSNWEAYTGEMRWTDRVLSFTRNFLAYLPEPAPPPPDPDILYASATGDPGTPLVFPLNAVRWRTLPRDIAALVTDSGPRRFEAQLFHFGPRPRPMAAELLLLAPGEYQVRLVDPTTTTVHHHQRLTLDHRREAVRFELPPRTLLNLSLSPAS